jgi:2-polyprenyl-6-methoxyphenol hydroxylase-like FAD-dependent oxidoreductase
MEVAIFGGGIAGLMTAAALTAHGHVCRVYEGRMSALHGGMGFILLNEGIEQLARYGIVLECPAGNRRGVPLKSFKYRNADGEVAFAEEMPGGCLAMRRADLIASLVQALPEGTVVEDALDNIEFDDQLQVTRARMRTGRGIEADLYVAADGRRSVARRFMFPLWPQQDARVVEIVGCVHCESPSKQLAPSFSLNKYHASEGGLAIGVLPVGERHTVWYMQLDAQRFTPSALDLKSLHAFAVKLGRHWPEAVCALIKATEEQHIHLWHPVQSHVTPVFHTGNLVLVGDAAQSLSPFTSRGVSAALEDAVCLARSIATKPTLDEALAAYSLERRRAREIHIQQGNELTELFLQPAASGKRCRVPVAE